MIKQTLKLLTTFEKSITFFAFLVLVTVMFTDVAMREITGTGLHWSRQVGVYANLFVVMFGLGVASSEGAHLRPKFSDNWLPKKFEPVLIQLQEGFMSFFCLCFAIIAFQVVAETYRDDVQSIVLRMAIWPFQMVIPIAFFIAAIRHSIYAIHPKYRPLKDTEKHE
ncbi:MAG: TRAP transporter small permease [Gammaproteobacteria bacterium]|jgi:C4-dicarboxylate transporter DctQ subunit|nr:TRAP transporter small permease [Gammaproteobacteria bacterium]MBT5216345.1 TRAP transporter small permease [Gammaproteobacteria bacterium]MBT5541835.1 TRAP transporter small permease [Gammaproteobacteria bacterium]MBT6074819.1 TRAP transporter small permease [Gammaproteobacteria bacterium]MBT7754457.1 TRAP transporter small permease [Gammaproteobacteria bacterium]